MAGFFAEMIEVDDDASARLIFRSIINQNARIAIMRNLLERSPHHEEKTDFFDETIDEFTALNVLRNKYLHSLWYTHGETGDVYIEEVAKTYLKFIAKREVPIEESNQVLARMDALIGKLMDRRRVRHLAQALASP